MDPETELHRLLKRPSRAFDLWCEERFTALGSMAKVLDELVTLSDDRQRELFGDFHHRIELLPGMRTDAVTRICNAVGKARREQRLENRIKQPDAKPDAKAREEAEAKAQREAEAKVDQPKDQRRRPTEKPPKPNREPPRNKGGRPRDKRKRKVYESMVAKGMPIDPKSFVREYRIHHGQDLYAGKLKAPSVDAAKRFLLSMRHEQARTGSS